MPSPGAGLGIAAPQGRETPAGAGWRKVKQRCLWGGFGRECYPALRSEGLFGSETGSPRARAVQGTGILCAGVVGEPNPACGPHA